MNVILGITGSVAAYKGAFLARLLAKNGHKVRSILTEAAEEFITPVQLSSLTGEMCYGESDFFKPGAVPIHIELSQWADILVVAPASYDFIGKAARGIADGLLLSVFAAFRKAVVLAPAMHSDMWSSPYLAGNLEKLRGNGVQFVGPVEGELSSGDKGPGRMAEPAEIADFIEKLCSRMRVLRGKRVLIAYGRTEEEIDPVRVVTNRSSGRMGYHLAARAKALGAHTVLVEAEISFVSPPGDEKYRVRTHAKMKEILDKLAPEANIIIMNAAVSDFIPEKRAKGKIRRGRPLTLSLLPTSDILAELGRNKRRNQLLVGFALESGNLEEVARRKLSEKNLDIIVANTLEAPGSDLITGLILNRKGKIRRFVRAAKAEVALALFDEIPEMLREGS